MRVFCVVVSGEFCGGRVANVVIKLPDFVGWKMCQVSKIYFGFFLATWAIISNTLPEQYD